MSKELSLNVSKRNMKTNLMEEFNKDVQRVDYEPPLSYIIMKSAFTSTFLSSSSIIMLAATGDHCNESQPSTSSIESSQLCRHFEFHDILLATDNFNESLVIGRGGFGKVYKGNITNGSTVSVAAIKRLDPMSGQGASEFWAEVEMLSKFRHCHLVSLFGYCNHEKEMILVYEYMPNGTLEDHLHKLGTRLSWLQRLKICIGAARGLDYLHTGTGISVGVIHRDVKSSNILLDERWAAKISDFGLSKIGPTNQSLTYVNTLVKGTFGYLDPDYTWTGLLTRKSDVYAFGVVLLEALCRKRAVERNPGEEPINLARWAQESIKKGNLKHIVDSNINGEISPKCLKELARIAEKCLLSNPKQRPTMAEVVVGLGSVPTLQEKINTSLQAAGKTIFGKMIDMLPSSTNIEKSAHVDSKLSSNSKVKSRNADDKIEDGNKYSINPVPSLKMFTFADLAKATIYFSQALSPDVYEEVFIGWVDKNTYAPSTQGTGIMVAVERYFGRNDLNCQRVASVLGQMAHPNVIRLLGYCNQRESESLLVYEHMHMENLGHFLFGDVAKPLSWKTRLMIMIGVARGLAYIHFSQNHLIHCDVKTFNILLDEDFNAKLGLFGKEKSIHGMRDTFSLIHFGNRRPYLDPDYLQTGQMTMKSDIYSFGVVLLETLTGQRAINMNSRDGEYCNLVRWASPFLEERSELKKIMDPRLEENYSLKGAFKCSALALRCLALDRKNRPSSEEVLRSLEEIYAVNR